MVPDEPQDLMRCGDPACGVTLPAGLADEPVESRTPCASCGGTRRVFARHLTATIAAFGSLEAKQRRPGFKKPIREILTGGDLHRDSGEVRQRERNMDRLGDWYDETITRPDGTVVVDQHHPLSEHRGHGSAKLSKKRSTQSRRGGEEPE